MQHNESLNTSKLTIHCQLCEIFLQTKLTSVLNFFSKQFNVENNINYHNLATNAVYLVCDCKDHDPLIPYNTIYLGLHHNQAYYEQSNYYNLPLNLTKLVLTLENYHFKLQHLYQLQHLELNILDNILTNHLNHQYIVLSDKETLLLKKLFTHYPNSISKHELMHDVWTLNSQQPNILAMTLSNLRKKLLKSQLKCNIKNIENNYILTW